MRKYSVVSLLFILALGEKEKEVCYGELGCFSTGEPWSSGKRPLPPPQGPEEVVVNFYLHTRVHPELYTITTWPYIQLEEMSSFVGSKMTMFYVHGWSQTGNDSRLDSLKDVILQRMDANVILVDWGATSHVPYPQAVANARIVSAQIARLCLHLIKKRGSSAKRLHLIGISLGAHIAAYVAKQIPGVYRLTGLDPAQPLFHDNNKKMKLNVEDADFVEVLHTNGRPTLPLLGLGIFQPLGHVDFYFNGGWDQPGCTNDGNKRTITELESGNYNLSENLHLRVFCPHVRSLLYYIEALSNPDCTFWGVKRSQSVTFLNILSGGWLARYIVSLRGCDLETCTPVGLDTINYPARGRFDVATSKTTPYCIPHPDVLRKMTQQLSSYQPNITNLIGI